MAANKHYIVTFHNVFWEQQTMIVSAEDEAAALKFVLDEREDIDLESSFSVCRTDSIGAVKLRKRSEGNRQEMVARIIKLSQAARTFR